MITFDLTTPVKGGSKEYGEMYYDSVTMDEPSNRQREIMDDLNMMVMRAMAPAMETITALGKSTESVEGESDEEKGQANKFYGSLFLSCIDNKNKFKEQLNKFLISLKPHYEEGIPVNPADLLMAWSLDDLYRFVGFYIENFSVIAK